ncbi:MAG: hypothetical protein Q4E53_08910 [Eubacteriales bacterium]|nr:hypothetical protein [Eubacteriales bacterium]
MEGPKKKTSEAFERLEKYLQDMGTHTSVVLELIVAILVFIACIVGTASLVPMLGHYIMSGEWSGLNEFLEQVLTMVVGIEFLKMLCKPTSTNVLETIMFVIARHMILADLPPLQNMIYVLSIVVLILTKRFISITNKKRFMPKKEEKEETSK